MWVLKCVGYLIAAIAVLTVLACGGVLIILVGIVFGLVLSLTGSTLFTASALRSYFEKPEERSDSDKNGP